MLAIMQAESGCNPNNHNLADRHSTCTGSYGLFQIGCVHGIYTDPTANIQKAYEIYQSQGITAWGAYTNGSYLRFI